MRDYSPKRRTAVVLAGTGTSGAYRAGVLRALDESGIRVDLVVGSGMGAVAAAFSAAAAGARLYDDGGFWDRARWSSFFNLRPALRTAILLLSCSFGVFLLPVLLALLAGLLFLPLALVDLALPGATARLAAFVAAAPGFLRIPYLAALSVPIALLGVIACAAVLRVVARDRKRMAESFEWLLDARPGRRRLARTLWEICRGSAISDAPRSEAEIGRKYVALVAENLGQPGFRELIVRTADLETGTALPFVLLADAHRLEFASARARGPRSRLEGLPGAVDLRAEGYDALFFDAVATGLLPPGAARLPRVAFPRGGLFAGETHRLADACLVGGCGLSEALEAGADQVIVVTAVPEAAFANPRKRGPRGLADGLLSTLERQSVDVDLRSAERMNRMVETLGHRTEAGGRAWQDPATGRVYRDFSLYVVRPDRRPLGPLDLDGAQDPATEVLETTDDLLDMGYRDAFRLFVDPVVGAAPDSAPRPAEPAERPVPAMGL